MEVYDASDRNSPCSRPERRGLSRRTVIEAAKEAVLTVDFADQLCGPGQMRTVGDKRRARCPLPDHEDNSPSFTVYPSNNSWFCYGCLRGGDVIELARFAWSYPKSRVAEAAAMLLMEFGHGVPQRSGSWFRKQERQRPIRDGLAAVRVRSLQRRLFRLFEPMISKILDPEERAAEARRVWEDLAPLAVQLYELRRGEDG